MSDTPLAGKVIALMVANGFDEIDFTGAQKRLIKLGATIRVVSRANGLVHGWYDDSWGHFFPVDVDLVDTLAIDYDGLMIPGGQRSVEKMAEDPHSLRVLKAFMRASMPVALIGDAVGLLVLAESADGRTVTGTASLQEIMTTSGATWQDEPVVTDAALVTGAGSESAGAAIDAFAELVAAYRREDDHLAA